MNLRLFKRFKSLMMKSAVIQLAIEDERSKKYPNWVKIVMLKKQRLAVKDKLARLHKRGKPAAGTLAGQH